MTIRVLHIISSLRLGGAQVCVKYLVEHATPGAVEPVVLPLRGRQVDIPIAGPVITLPYRRYDPRKFTAILRICRDQQIDVIHAHLQKPILGALLASYSRPVRVVVHEHGPIVRAGWDNAVYRWGLRRLRGRAAAFIAISQAVARALEQRAGVDPARMRVIHNAVDLEAFGPDAAARQQARAEWGAAAEDVVLGFAGRLTPVKGPDLALECLTLLWPKDPRYLLVFLGDGPQRAALEERARRLGVSRRVRFLGFRREVGQLLNGFDVALAPSRQEPFGMVALEFMRTGVPLVCSGVQGLGEIVTDGRTGLIAATSDAAAYARCVERLICDSALRTRLGAAASRWVEQFGVEQYVDKVEQVYREIMHA